MSYDELLTTASMKSVYCIRLHQALITLFKCLSSTGLTYIGNLFKHRLTPYGLRGEGLILELHNFNLKFKKNSFTYLLTKLWNSLPSHVRLSSDANDFKSKLQDCSFLEHTVLWFSCHVLVCGFLAGFSFLHFMFLSPSFYISYWVVFKIEYHKIAVIIIDLMYIRSVFWK